MAHATQSPDAYDALLDHYETITGLGGAAGILSWDQEVMMPEVARPPVRRRNQRCRRSDTTC